MPHRHVAALQAEGQRAPADEEARAGAVPAVGVAGVPDVHACRQREGNQMTCWPDECKGLAACSRAQQRALRAAHPRPRFRRRHGTMQSQATMHGNGSVPSARHTLPGMLQPHVAVPPTPLRANTASQHSDGTLLPGTHRQSDHSTAAWMGAWVEKGKGTQDMWCGHAAVLRGHAEVKHTRWPLICHAAQHLNTPRCGSLHLRAG